MKIGDDVFFAPRLPFDEVVCSPDTVIDLIRDRMEGFFFGPGRRLSAPATLFPPGLLAVIAVEAVCRLDLRLRPAERTTRDTYIGYCRKALPSFHAERTARSLYEDFRCGMVHEARIKKDGQFSLDTNQAAEMIGNVQVINPRCLLEEVRNGCEITLAAADASHGGRTERASWLEATFVHDLPS